MSCIVYAQLELCAVRVSAYSSRDGSYLVVTEVDYNEISGLEELIWYLTQVIVAHVLREGEGGRVGRWVSE